MAHAAAAMAGTETRPLLISALPKLPWPLLSRRSRALLMIGIMISPAFISDYIGYAVQRIFYTPDQIADRAAGSILGKIDIFRVACPEADAAAGYWTVYAAQNGWRMYPEAGPSCFKPDRSLLGVAGLKSFNVACPVMALSPSEQRHWVAYSSSRGWNDFPQAGAGCVDP